MTTFLPAPTAPALAALLPRVRRAVDGPPDPAGTADRLAVAMTAGTPGLEVLTDAQRRADPDRLTSHVLHAERAFSVVALVLGPGQQTSIHDHRAWCVVTVLCGAEQETLYRDHGDHLAPTGWSTNRAGTVTAFAPPGDIHRVGNGTDATAISLHIYGTDLRLAGSSVRRTYALPVRHETCSQENR